MVLLDERVIRWIVQLKGELHKVMASCSFFSSERLGFPLAIRPVELGDFFHFGEE
jgi:hypothetical protein